MSSCGCGSSDQTPKESVKAVYDKAKKFPDGKSEEYLRSAHGTGLFLVPAPDLGVMEYRTIIAPNLNRRETVKRGQNCAAYKWISHDYISEDEVRKGLSEVRLTDCFSQFCLYGNCESWDCWCDTNSNFCDGGITVG